MKNHMNQIPTNHSSNSILYMAPISANHNRINPSINVKTDEVYKNKKMKSEELPDSKLLIGKKCATTDGTEYLRTISEEQWLNRLKCQLRPERIQEPVIAAVKRMMEELKFENLDLIIEKVFSRGAIGTYLEDSFLEIEHFDHFKERQKVEACFCATIMKHMIINNLGFNLWNPNFFKNQIISGEYHFLGNLSGSNDELDYLSRFISAIFLAKSLTSPQRKMSLFLNIGTLLEGSGDDVSYNPSQLKEETPNYQETRKRIILLEHFCIRGLTKQLKRPGFDHSLNILNPESTNSSSSNSCMHVNASIPINIQNTNNPPSSSIFSPTPFNQLQNSNHASAFDHEVFFIEFYKKYFVFLKESENQNYALVAQLREELNLLSPYQNFNPQFNNHKDYVIAFDAQLKRAKEEVRQTIYEKNIVKEFKNYRNLTEKLKVLCDFFNELTSPEEMEI